MLLGCVGKMLFFHCFVWFPFDIIFCNDDNLFRILENFVLPWLTSVY